MDHLDLTRNLQLLLIKWLILSLKSCKCMRTIQVIYFHSYCICQVYIYIYIKPKHLDQNVRTAIYNCKRRFCSHCKYHFIAWLGVQVALNLFIFNLRIIIIVMLLPLMISYLFKFPIYQWYFRILLHWELIIDEWWKFNRW